METKDINILISMINMKLRDDDMSLSSLATMLEMDEDSLQKDLDKAGYFYDSKTNQLKQK
ncbi:MAG: DUF4250 domain-containing protein [Thomasclavelia sp.]|jgi:endonuclease III-like uncharacterized protein|nr:DUF4250 domain-containing protein [Thomasclavelia sp.]